MKIYQPITFLFFLCFIFCENNYSQKSDHSQIYAKIDKSIETINRLLGNDCKLSFDKELIAVFYEHGVPFREDRVYLDALDPHNINFSEEENAITVYCLEFKELKGKLRKRYGKGCIWREFSKDKKKLTYSRVAFKAKNEHDTPELKNELKILILLGHELIFK